MAEAHGRLYFYVPVPAMQGRERSHSFSPQAQMIQPQEHAVIKML